MQLSSRNTYTYSIYSYSIVHSIHRLLFSFFYMRFVSEKLMQCLNLRKCGFNLSYNFDRRIDVRRVRRDFYMEHFFSSFIM